MLENRAAAAAPNAAPTDIEGPPTAAHRPPTAPSWQKLINHRTAHRAPTAKAHKIRAGAPPYRVKTRRFADQNPPPERRDPRASVPGARAMFLSNIYQ